MTELQNIGATHVLDRYDPQVDLVTQVHGIVGGKENITRIFDCANWTYGMAAAMAAPKQPSKLRILHPIDANDEVKNKDNRPNLDAAFIVGATEALEPLSKDFWTLMPECVEKEVLEYHHFESLRVWTLSG